MSTPEQREVNQRATLEQFIVALGEAWKLLDSAVDYLPGDLRDEALTWCQQNLLWGAPQTVEDAISWERQRGLR